MNVNQPKCSNIGSPTGLEIIENLIHLHILQCQSVKPREGLQYREVVDAIQVGLAPLEVVEVKLLQVGKRPGQRLQ